MKLKEFYSIFVILLFTLSLASCDPPAKETGKQKHTHAIKKKEKTEIKTASIKPKGKTITVNSDQGPLQLVFDSISEAAFNQLKARKFLKSIKPKQKGNEFYIETAVRRHTFKKCKDYGEPENWNGYELKGYYPELKLYVLTENSTAEHLGFGELFLLDSLTDYRYIIPSIGDGSVEVPIPSPNNKYLVYYYNWVYDHQNSDLEVVKINSKAKPEKYLELHASYSSTEFAVEEIIWESDHCFYVKGYRETYDGNRWNKEFKYYRTVFR